MFKEKEIFLVSMIYIRDRVQINCSYPGQNNMGVPSTWEDHDSLQDIEKIPTMLESPGE